MTVNAPEKNVAHEVLSPPPLKNTAIEVISAPPAKSTASEVVDVPIAKSVAIEVINVPPVAKTAAEFFDPGGPATSDSLNLVCIQGVLPNDPNARSNFVRQFQHQDWVDGESLVQAGRTPDEEGLNERFHKIEADLDALGGEVGRAFDAIQALRGQIRVCLSELVRIVHAQGKNDTKDTNDTKDAKDSKESKDNKESKDHKDSPDAKHTTENKHAKDLADKDAKEGTKEGLGAAEKRPDELHRPPILVPAPALFAPSLPSDLRVFIRPDERPVLGEQALNAPRVE